MLASEPLPDLRPLQLPVMSTRNEGIDWDSTNYGSNRDPGAVAQVGETTSLNLSF